MAWIEIGADRWTDSIAKAEQRPDVIDVLLPMQFQAQAFNVTNHTNFANPAAAQTQIYSVNGGLSGTAGALTSVATPGRQLQFALKLIF